MSEAAKSKSLPEFKRRNRSLSLADAIAGTLDPVLKKRGFASRDIMAHWSAMAPTPYNAVAIPDKIVWPRGERSAEGATLYLRCMAGHGFAVAHDGNAIAAAVNRYYGYFLVKDIRLSAEPFSGHSVGGDHKRHQPSQSVIAKVGTSVKEVEDEGLREALRALGHAISSRPERKGE